LHADSSLQSSYGMKVHPDGKRLFVCVGDANFSRYSSEATKHKKARLISIDLATGKRLTDVELAGLAPGSHFPNDLTFDDKGNIYMTDSYANALYKIMPDGKASLFSRHPLFATAGIGLNGIVYHPSGFLLVNSSAKGRIFKVSLSDPQQVQPVKISQYFLGADGMVLKGGDTLAIAVNGGNDKIYQLTTPDNWQSAELAATTLIADRFHYPATLAQSGNDIWVMNAKTTELMDSNAIPSKFFALQLAKFKPIPKTK
jgi:sugar lactone lactonase YvrE